MTGQEPYLPVDIEAGHARRPDSYPCADALDNVFSVVKDNLKDAQDRYKRRYDFENKTYNWQPFSVGDQVVYRRHAILRSRK